MITGAPANIQSLVGHVPIAKGGVLSVAKVIDVSGHPLLGAVYQTDACSPAAVWDEFCTEAGVQFPSYVPPATGEKEFDDAPSLVENIAAFAIYAGVDCDLPNIAEASASALRRLAYNERVLFDDEFIAAIAGGSPTSLGATQSSLPKAVGAAEHYLATVYGGVGAILAPVRVVTQMCGAHLVYRDELDGGLYTCQGTPVAGYAVGTPVDTGANAIYATGRIVVLRQAEPIVRTSPPQQLADGTWKGYRAIAERIYIPLVECALGLINFDDVP